MPDLHTPGPWMVERNGVTVKQQKARWAQKICKAFEVFMSRSEREANARLIAAAPELLDALRGIVGDAEFGCDRPAYLAARAAIRKATEVPTNG